MIVKLLTVSKLKRRLQRLVRVYTYQNATLMEISCTGSILTHQFQSFNDLNQRIMLIGLIPSPSTYRQHVYRPPKRGSVMPEKTQIPNSLVQMPSFYPLQKGIAPNGKIQLTITCFGCSKEPSQRDGFLRPNNICFG